MDLNRINLQGELPADIFSDVAKEAAEHTLVHKNNGHISDVNKSTQLRKFYDELVMWHDKVQRAANSDETYRQVAPFIQMLKAKAAYSKGRGHVDKNFTEIFDRIISQINNAQTLHHAKLFFEAVMGYRKAYETK